MEDALCPALPDDPASLKSIIAMIAQQRDQATQQRDQATQQRDQATRRIAELQEEKQRLVREWELEKLRLQHQLEQLKKRYYGPRADTLDVGQLLLEFAVALESRPVNPQDLTPEGIAGQVKQGAANDGASLRRVNRGRRNIAAFDKLPVVQKVHDLSEDHKPCPCCNQMRQKIGEQRSWQIEYLPGQFQRIEHVQYKYACPRCEQNAENPNITLAPKPLQPIERGMAGPGLLAYVITSKFADHLPLYRLESIFGRNGFEIDRSTMSLWCGDAADLIQPLYQLMIQRVLGSHMIATDDTVLPMLAPPCRNCRKARLWAYLGDDDHPYNVFDFTLSRSRDGPALFLKNYNQVLLADAYGGYEGICIEKQMVQAGCWSHARRKFVDAQSLSPAIAIEALGVIGRLFAVEQQARDLSPVQRLALRQEQSLPVIGQLHQKLLAWKQQLLPRHPIAEAIGYVLNQWKPLTAFLADGAIPIHNNLAEQQMKRIALGRKNYLFVGNQRGGRTAAILCSITSTCRRHDIDPQLYLTQLLTNLPATPTSQLGQWLPDVWKERSVSSGIGVADAHAAR
jgi:transposase